ncbi:hypothetical protein CCR75_004036 [Bremia lactucae]|uniref:Macrophage erythroblast attacher n=1 Tax=Bremia lactucae TaxID=4779 RepID=A0A976IBJ2_BRELC|nr:hypothetical protein CCR75_004036 [Bremia lactucae]
MELSYPLVRVPFENASRNFRLYHKQLSRELLQITAQIEALGNSAVHNIDVEAATDKLAELAKNLRDLKQKAKDGALKQAFDLQSCATRTRYLKTLKDSETLFTSSFSSFQTPSMTDRLIADFLLSQGCLDTAKLIENTREISHLVDHDLHAECQAVLKDLENFHTDQAMTWCSQNGSRLRRLQSPLEFSLRLQTFIELVRAHKPLDAIQHARAYLTPLAIMQPDNSTLRDAAIHEVQSAMATLAFASPQTCGIKAYEQLFAMDRWAALAQMFRQTFRDVYGMHQMPSLSIVLYAGLSTLKTRACQVTRDAIANAGSATRGKRQRRDSEQGRDNDAEESRHQCDDEPDKSSPDDVIDAAASKKRKCHDVEIFVSLCPGCSDVGSQLCAGLPFAYHPHSRLVCRVTRQVMDEHNPPFMLPNGRVYSKQGIELLKQRSSDGMIQCIDTQGRYSLDDVKPVYIL